MGADLVRELHLVVDEVLAGLDAHDDWSHHGIGHAGQYGHDVAADAIAREQLGRRGWRVLSEESRGPLQEGDSLVAVVDPVDGSTNASLGIPHWAVSVCLLDDEGPIAGIVADGGTGERFTASRGGGAHLDGATIKPSGLTDLSKAVIGFSGPPHVSQAYGQARILGAAAVDICWVACGRLDAFVSTGHNLHVWDHAAAALVCAEAGAPLVEADGLDLYPLDHDARVAPVVAATPELLGQLLGDLGRARSAIRG